MDVKYSKDVPENAESLLGKYIPLQEPEVLGPKGIRDDEVKDDSREGKDKIIAKVSGLDVGNLPTTTDEPGKKSLLDEMLDAD